MQRRARSKKPGWLFDHNHAGLIQAFFKRPQGEGLPRLRSPNACTLMASTFNTALLRTPIFHKRPQKTLIYKNQLSSV